MKPHILITISFLALCLTIRGQEYRNIINTGTAFYSDSTNPSVYFSGVQADSVISMGGGDTLFFATNTFRPTTPAGIPLDISGGILGRKIEKLSNGWFRFYNAGGDTILLNTAATLNDTWKFISLPQTGRLMATCTSIQPAVFLGITDTVKSFTLQAKDAAGGNMAHYFNGKVIRLSRLYGLTEVYDLYRMPDSTHLYSLKGRISPPAGFRGLTWHDVYDYDTGDVFHVSTHENYMITAGHYTRDRKYIKTVTSKQVASGGATVTYTFSYCLEEYSFSYPSGYTTTYSSGTSTETWPYTNTPASNSGSFVPDIFNSSGIRYYAASQDIVPGIPCTGLKNNYYLCCWIYNPDYFNELNETEYAAGLGIVHDWHPAGFVFPGSYNFQDLVYYRKGTREWGTPFYQDCSGMIPVLSVAPSSLTIGYKAGDTAVMHLVSNRPWEISCPGFTFSPASGSGNADVIVTAADSNVTGASVNSYATITSSGMTKQYTITQLSKFIPIMYILTDTLELSWQAGSLTILMIYSNLDWSLVCEPWPAWVSAVQTSGHLNAMVNFNATEDNDSTSPRFATITLHSQYEDVNFVVRQNSHYQAGTDDKRALSASLSPNPVKETALICVPGLPAGEEKTIFLRDQTGRIVFSDVFRSQTYLFRRGTMTPGVYLITVKGNNSPGTARLKAVLEP